MSNSSVAGPVRCMLIGVVALAAAPAISFAADPIAVIAHLHAGPGREAEAEARLRKVVEFVRKAEPTITYRLYRSDKEPGVFIFYEVYPSQAAIDQHRTVTLPAFAKEYGKPAAGLFDGPPQVEKLRPLVD